MKPEDWVPPSYSDLRTKHFASHPFHCADCGAELQFKNPNREYAGRGERVMLKNYGNDALCGPCLGKRIAAWFADPGEGPDWAELPESGTCDTCHKETVVARSIQSWTHDINCRFGSRWWNGHQICCDCLVATATIGKQYSEMSGVSGSSWYQVNEAGARISNKT